MTQLRTFALALLSVTTACCEGQMSGSGPTLPPPMMMGTDAATRANDAGIVALADSGPGATDAGTVAAEDAGTPAVDAGAPPPPPPSSDAFVVGPWHAPLEDMGDASRWSGGTHNGSASDIASSLAAVRAAGARITMSVLRNRMKNDDGTLSIPRTRAELMTWRDAADVDSYFVDGTLIAIIVMDDAGGAAWGGVSPTAAQVDSIAQTVKELWPHARVGMRQEPSWGAPFEWHYMDLAWAQYDGPYRDGSPESYAASNVRAARAAHLGLVLGLNTLDGGCGPTSLGACRPGAPGTAIEGTFENATSVRRFQMTAAEMRLYGRIFLDEPYNCALLAWRYSSSYTRSSFFSDAQYAGVVAFDSRPDVIAAWDELVVAGRARAAGTCASTR